jgi:hypothetical protein
MYSPEHHAHGETDAANSVSLLFLSGSTCIPCFSGKPGRERTKNHLDFQRIIARFEENVALAKPSGCIKKNEQPYVQK